MLPVSHLINELTQSLTEQNVILAAPPGAGKSTFLPLKLLESGVFSKGKILMLQPRRVAARAIAQYLSAQLNEEVGQTIGYAMRGEKKVSARTRLEIVTEGLLTRKLQHDPELSDYALVIFDEFHERNIHADFSFALCLEVQSALRDDLRLLIMSATLDVERISVHLPNATIMQSEGRSYPIEYCYCPPKKKRLVDDCVGVICRAFNENTGNILVFLPGVGDINKVYGQLTSLSFPNAQISPLYGNLSKLEQQTAIDAPTQGMRKIVLATNVAETSLTIDGITVVVDSGMEKRSVFHLSRGISQLKQCMISQASAIQRAGRAGRLGPGVCYRMWEQEQQSRLNKQSELQILQSDIAPLLLDAALWGSALSDLPLLDQPSDKQVKQAQDLLKKLKAIDKNNRITAHGKLLAALPCHPRLAHLLLVAKEYDCGALACLLVAVLEGKDPLSGKEQTDIYSRLYLLRQQKHHALWTQGKILARALDVNIHAAYSDSNDEIVPMLLCSAFSDHIGKRRNKGRFILANGSGGMMDRFDPLSDSDFVVCAGLFLTNHADANIGLATKVDITWLKKQSHLLDITQHVAWQNDRITAFEQTSLGAIELSKTPLPKVDESAVIACWRERIHQTGLAVLFDEKCQRWLQQIKLAHSLGVFDGSQFTDEQLKANLETWCLPFIGKVYEVKQLAKVDMLTLLKNQMSYPQQQALVQLFPSKITVPSGNNHALRYEDNGDVVLPVKMTELYGLTDTPTIANGKITLTLEMLSPASRPIQTTQDLAGFWQGSYAEVKKDMKGRYPKHFWPDDPANAQATTKTKKRM